LGWAAVEGEKRKSPANSSIARMYEPVREDFVDSKKSQKREREKERKRKNITTTKYNIYNVLFG
jgi:hypothetical protein